VSLMPQRHAYLSCALNLTKIQFVFLLNKNFNMMILKFRGVSHTQSCDPLCGIDVIWRVYNTVVLKLQSVCRTQSCDTPCGIEIT
jgi:hypothetical protein